MNLRVPCEQCMYARERDDGGADLFCDYDRCFPFLANNGVQWLPRVTARKATCKDAVQDLAKIPTQGGVQ